MRELTKSMMSFSWAMSLYGLRRMAGLFDVRSAGSAAHSFETVTRCTEDQLGTVAQSVFRAGDNLQRSMVDLLFNVLAPETGTPSSSMGGTSAFRRGVDAVQSSARMGADMLQRTAQTGVDVLQRTAQAAASAPAAGATSATEEPLGWGPVPPPGL